MILKILQTLVLLSLTHLHATKTKKDSSYTFQDYIQKFDPSNIWEKIDRRRSYEGEKISIEQETEEILDGIDATDELLRLKVTSSNMTAVNARRYRPLPLRAVERDKWNYRFRFYELMKQVIFDVRNKMVPMTTKRHQYKNSPIYKMGFVTAKADWAAKTFSKIAYRSFKLCSYRKFERIRNLGIVKTVMSAERLLNLWFDLDLLADVIERNDLNCKKVLEAHATDRKNKWKWED